MRDAKVQAGVLGECKICDFPVTPGSPIKPVGDGSWVHKHCWEATHE